MQLHDINIFSKLTVINHTSPMVIVDLYNTQNTRD